MTLNQTINEAPEQVEVFVNDASGRLPEYSTPDSAGMDVRAFLSEPIVLAPGDRALIPTGLRIQLPRGYEMQLRPRSGLALRSGITLLNSPGTIDADYRGEVGVILVNLSQSPFTVNDGDRIAQMVLARYSAVSWKVTANLDKTFRGEGGFGHTGTR